MGLLSRSGPWGGTRRAGASAEDGSAVDAPGGRRLFRGHSHTWLTRWVGQAVFLAQAATRSLLCEPRAEMPALWMFTAAFTSRSCSVPHRSHRHRSLASGFCRRSPHAEQSCAGSVDYLGRSGRQLPSTSGCIPGVDSQSTAGFRRRAGPVRGRPVLRTGRFMGRRWTESADTAVRLASALDWEHGGRGLVDLADRLGRTESAVRQRASRLRAVQLEGDVDGPGARAALAAR